MHLLISSVQRAIVHFSNGLSIALDTSSYHYKSRRAGQAALEQRIREICETRVRYGYPNTIRVDNSRAFISRDLDLWAYANDVTLDFSRPGKPTDNGFIEAFNSKLRAECLL
jgi:transposase InsO family protein